MKILKKIIIIAIVCSSHMLYANGPEKAKLDALEAFKKVVSTGNTPTGAKLSDSEMGVLQFILHKETSKKESETEFVSYIRNRYASSQYDVNFNEKIMSASGSQQIVKDLAIILYLSKGSPVGLIEYTRLTGSIIDIDFTLRELGIDNYANEALLRYEVFALLDNLNKARTSFYLNGKSPVINSGIIDTLASIQKRYGKNRLTNRLIFNYIAEYDSVVKLASRIDHNVYQDTPKSSSILKEYYIRLAQTEQEKVELFSAIESNFSKKIFEEFVFNIASDYPNLPFPNVVKKKIIALISLDE